MSTALVHASRVFLAGYTGLIMVACSAGDELANVAPANRSSIQVNVASTVPAATTSVADISSQSNDTASDANAGAIGPNAYDIGGSSLVTVFSMSNEDAIVVNRAIASLISRCMDERGFKYSDSEPVIPEVINVARLYPTNDELAAHGYLYKVRAQGEREPISVVDQSAEYYAALDGTASTIGCGQAAADSLDLAQMSQFDNTVAQAASEIRVKAAESDAYVDILTAWRDCMASAGYLFRSTDDAIDAAESMDGGFEGVAARELATVDFGCRRQVSLAERDVEVRRSLTAAWIEAHPDFDAEMRSAQEGVVTRAKQALHE